ncbi:MAG: hypothetical protein Q8936_03770 [Bacillota bacterium]|nr:hypothetical protein [Bacillota bacterium]
MVGRIIDLNSTDAFINFEDGTTMDINVSRIPKNSRIGDVIDVEMSPHIPLANDKLVDFF